MNITEANEDKRFSSQWVNLAMEQLGAKVLYATNDFFAEKENLIKPGRGIYMEERYTERGKWMDGWESRRKRTQGHDYCIVRLGLTGIIRGIDIDTNHFLGNHPPYASVEACYSESDATDSSDWVEIIPRSFLSPGTQNLFQTHVRFPFNHVRLNIYPDGGIARLKVYGDVHVDPANLEKKEEIDLAALVNGGKVLGTNDMFFSSSDNLILPGRGVNMGDGWETRRRRIPGNDWLIVKLASEGVINRAVIDTLHFKGNFPDECSLDGVRIIPEGGINQQRMPPRYSIVMNLENIPWTPLMHKVPLEADREHVFEDEILNIGPITHVRLNIFPDGGVGRLRLFGVPQ